MKLIEPTPLVDIPARLDAGDFDNNPMLAISLITEYFRAEERKDITADNHSLMLVYRWLVADAFIADQIAVTGRAEYTYSNGQDTVNMPLYPNTERLSIANNIEGALIGQFGTEQGTKNAAIYYSNMLNMNGTPRLSAMGLEIMRDLHNSFLSAFLLNGLPEVRHDA